MSANITQSKSNVRPSVRQSECDGAAQATRRSCYQRDLTSEIKFREVVHRD